MKLKKSFLCIALTITISILTCCVEANALFGNTHFYLGKNIIEQSGVSLSKSEENAFLSGLVYADIGRFKFDRKTGVDSDSDKFVTEMKKYADTPEEKWFVRGFEMHVIQDKKTGEFLKGILCRESSSYLEYIKDCSLLDSYFLRKSGNYIYNDFLDKFNFEQVSEGINMGSLSKVAGIPENKVENFVSIALGRYSVHPNKYRLTMYGDLIKKTYRSLGFELNLDDIYEQAANVVGAFAVTASFAEKSSISEDLASRIEDKSEELVKLCISRF